MNPYLPFIQELSGVIDRARQLPLGGFTLPQRTAPADDAPCALIFSPHPDDEVIIGGLPLRLARELGWRIINVAVTQGSYRARQAERLRELEACCASIGFSLMQAAPDGLEGITLKARASDPERWKQSVGRIAEILREHRPAAVFFPHDDDWNGTHIGTHHLVVEALRAAGEDLRCLAVETEFWGDMRSPNLMAESSASYVADLIAALSFHVGEVKRNPYHLRMPAWLMDNVRRGGERVGGQGGAAPDFRFATLYRLRRWRGGFENILERGAFLGTDDDLRQWFARA